MGDRIIMKNNQNRILKCPVIIVTNDANKSYNEYLSIISTGCGVGIDTIKADIETINKLMELIPLLKRDGK